MVANFYDPGLSAIRQASSLAGQQNPYGLSTSGLSLGQQPASAPGLDRLSQLPANSFQGALGKLSGLSAPMPSTLDSLASAFGSDNAFGTTARGAVTGASTAASAFGSFGAGNPFGSHPAGGYGWENPWSRFDEQAQATLAKYSGFQSGYTGGGNVGAVGQGIGQFDAGADADIAKAAAATGVPANLLKAVVARESSGDWNANSHWVNSVRGGARIYGYVGVFEDAARSWGFNFDALNGNRLGQLEMLGTGLRRFYDQSPGHDWSQAVSMHFSGDWNPSGYTDELGNNDASYVSQVLSWWKQLDSSAGNSGNYQNLGGMGADPTNTANAVLQQAMKYVGVPYVWGGIPGKGQDPWNSGWDCSGFTYWLDQNYGGGQLPMGSHYQYQDALNKGKLFTNVSQLQPGDLVFFDTGWYGGAGGDMNRAGHVGVYLGNGKMLHAANPDQGTIVSDFSGYYQQRFIGAEHMSWSSAGGGYQSSYGGGVSGYQRSAGGIPFAALFGG